MGIGRYVQGFDDVRRDHFKSSSVSHVQFQKKTLAVGHAQSQCCLRFSFELDLMSDQFSAVIL